MLGAEASQCCNQNPTDLVWCLSQMSLKQLPMKNGCGPSWDLRFPACSASA